MRWLCGSPVLLRPHRIPQIKTMRYRSIDFLRTAAVFEMVVVHFLDHLTDFDYSVGVFSAPMFLILSGASSHIWLASQKRQRKDHLATRRSLVNRGMCLYAFGTAINVAVFGVDPVYCVACDVLNLAGIVQLFLVHIWEVRSAVLR